MINCISVDNMRSSDAYTIENFVDSLELMRRAAYGIFKAVHWHGSIAVVVGSGNNGGDGFALACILKEHGFSCCVFTVAQRYSADSTYYFEQAQRAGIAVYPFALGCLQDYSMVVDCLLGTGFHGAVRENYRMAIEEINRSSAYVVSADINSGMNGDTGDVDVAVESDVTVTIGYVKTGLITQNAGKYIKKLVCADIGVVLLREEGKICTPDELLLPGCVRCPAWLDMEIIDAK